MSNTNSIKKTKKERKDILITAIYVMAVTAARDTDVTQQQDKEVLSLIRDYMNEFLILDNANPNMVVLQTIGISEFEGLKLAKEIKALEGGEDCHV